MATYTQTDRPLELITPLGPDALLLEKFSGREQLSGLFHFHLDMLAPASREILFDKVLGQAMTVRIQHGKQQVRTFHGVCSRLRQGPPLRVDQGTFIRYQAEMVPHFWFWEKQVTSRIFQDQNVPDIFRAVVKDLDDSLDFSMKDVRESYPPRDYCVQFEESSYAFLSRLLEEEGIYFYFEPTPSGHRLVLSDQSLQHPRLPEPYDPVAFNDTGRNDAEAITAWEKTQDVTAAGYVVRDYSFELPTSTLEARSKLRARVSVGDIEHPVSVPTGERVEVYTHNGDYGHRFDSLDAAGKERKNHLQRVFQENQRQADLQADRLALESLNFEGRSRCPGFNAGCTFSLDKPERLKGRYLLTSVEHVAKQAPYRSGQDVAFEYENRFSCVPNDLPYRPARTSRPRRIHGTMTATVAGPMGSDIHTDKYGRIKVRFHWDRRDRPYTNNSCWVRVVQSWAGKGFGTIHIPRVGNEVIVAFEEGHPDRPIVLGSVYNAENMPPFNLPEHATDSGIKTQTIGKPKHSSGLIFSDSAKEERVQLQSHGELVLDAHEKIYMAAGDKLVNNVGVEFINAVGWTFPSAQWQGGLLVWYDMPDMPLAPTIRPDLGTELGRVAGNLMTDIFGGTRWDLTRGTHLTAEGMLSNHYTFFSHNEIVIDPTSWVSAQIPSAKWGNISLMGKVPSGRSEMTYGSRATTNYGVTQFTQHGPYLSRHATSKPWELVWSIGHGACSLATLVLPFLHVSTKSTALQKAADYVNDAANVFLAFGNITKRKTAMADATLTAGKVVEQLPKMGTKNFKHLFKPMLREGVEYAKFVKDVIKTSEIIHNHSVDGTYAVQAERVQLTGGDGGISLAAAKPITIMSFDQAVTLASGGSTVVVSEEDKKVVVSCSTAGGFGGELVVEGNQATLSAGGATVTLGNGTITMRTLGASIEIGPAGAIKIKGTTIDIETPSGTLKGPNWNFSL